MQRRYLATFALFGAAALAVWTLPSGTLETRPAPKSKSPVTTAIPAPPRPTTPTLQGDLPTCQGSSATTGAVVDERVRDAAQRGLAFLADSTVQWQRQHNCYGCHVQAVTLKAMSMGRHHGYQVDEDALATVVQGLTTVTGGSRSTGGLRYSTNSFLSASKSLGGAAFALYDEWIATSLTDDLLQTARELRVLQSTSGAITSDYQHAPVAIGALQDTVLAMATWNQAYARTADDSWLTAVGRDSRPG